MRIFTWIVLLMALLVTSCSVSKRSYRKGYHVEWAFAKKRVETTRSLAVSQVPENAVSVTVEPVLASSDDLFAVSDIKKQITLNSDTCGDRVIFKNGDIITAKVLEITDDKIKYKRCDNIQGPMVVVAKASGHSIKYVNGVTDIIEPPAYNDNPISGNGSSQGNANNDYKGVQKTHPKAIAALLLTITGFYPLVIIGWILGLIFAVKAQKEIIANPKRYKGLKLARFIKFFTSVLLGLIAFFLILAILASL